MVILGLLVVIAAVVAGVGVYFNSMNEHSADVAVFNWMLSGQTNQIVLIAMLVGALGMLGLMMVIGRTSAIAGDRRATRRELREMNRENKMMRKDRDRLARQNRDLAQTTAVRDEPGYAAAPRRHWWHRFSHRQPTHA
ncbi:MAG: hypothetical protein LLG14_09460 [Nocardiaceae bacterium]|nr:hypothetical protein [Nocardiaceae bacterium]